MLDMTLKGLGLVTLGIGVKMFLGGKNLLAVAMAVALGGALGQTLGIDNGLRAFGDWAQQSAGSLGQGRFAEAVVTTSVLYCVGPMTVLGCLQDGLEGKIELLSIKSVLDGISSIFFAALLGPGVLVTVGVVLLVQGSLTAMARPLKPIAERPELMADAIATGGAAMLAIGFGLTGIAEIPAANFLPGLVLAPVLSRLLARFTPT